MNRFAAVFGSASVIALAAASTASAADITGRITEATGAIGLEGAIVTIVETGRTVSSGRDGSFAFRGLSAGEYTVSVNYLGADIQTRAVTLDSDAAIADVNFTLGADVAVVENILVVGQRGQLTSATTANAPPTASSPFSPPTPSAPSLTRTSPRPRAARRA